MKIKSPKIRTVSFSNRKREFYVGVGKELYVVSYSYFSPSIFEGAIIAKAAPDPEQGNTGVEFHLKSGEVGWFHLDHVLAYVGDPEYWRKMTLYNVSLKAQKLFQEKKMSVRGLARAMNTSTAQIYRLLNQANYDKTLDQMFKVIKILGGDVHVDITSKKFSERATRKVA